MLLATLRALAIPDRQKDVFRAYYGLDGISDDLTLELLGQKYGVTRERIRQMNANTIMKLGEAGVNMDAAEITELLTSIRELDKIVTNDVHGSESSLEPTSDMTIPTFEGVFRINPDFEYRIDTGPATPQHILEAVASAYGVQVKTVSSRREWKYVWTRNVSIFLMLQDLKMSFEEVRKFLERQVSWPSYQNSLKVIRASGNIQQDIERIRTVYCHLLALGQPQKLFPKTGDVTAETGVHEDKITKVLATVAKSYKVPVERLKAQDRHKVVAWARHVAAYILHENLGMSYPAIGSVLGKDHTTIIHSCQLVADTISKLDQVREDVEKLRKACPSIVLSSPLDTPVSPPPTGNSPSSPTKSVSAEMRIIDAAGKHYGIPTNVLLGLSRDPVATCARQVAYFLLVTKLKFLLCDIAVLFNRKENAVTKAYEEIKILIEEDAEVRRDVRSIRI